MTNLPAMIIDFEATDVSKEAEATQLGYREVSFDDEGDLIAETCNNCQTEFDVEASVSFNMA